MESKASKSSELDRSELLQKQHLQRCRSTCCHLTQWTAWTKVRILTNLSSASNSWRRSSSHSSSTFHLKPSSSSPFRATSTRMKWSAFWPDIKFNFKKQKKSSSSRKPSPAKPSLFQMILLDSGIKTLLFQKTLRWIHRLLKKIAIRSKLVVCKFLVGITLTLGLNQTLHISTSWTIQPTSRCLTKTNKKNRF